MTKEKRKAAESSTSETTTKHEEEVIVPILGTKPPDPKKEIDRIKEEYQEDKKKRKKYKKRELAEESLKSDVVLFSDVLCHVLDLMVKRLPNPLELTKTEKLLFIDSSNKLLTKYVPKVSEWKEEIGFALVLTVLISPRMKKSTSKENEKSEIVVPIVA